MKNNKNALVVGAASGIGRALSISLAKDGWQIIALSRNKDNLASLADRIEGDGNASPILVSFDLKRLDNIGQLCKDLKIPALDLIVFAKGANTTATRVIDLSVRNFAEEMNSSLISCQMLLAGLEGHLKKATNPKIIWLTCNQDKDLAFRGLSSMIHRSREAMASAYEAETQRISRTFDPGDVGSGKWITPYYLRNFAGKDEASDQDNYPLGDFFVKWLKEQGKTK